jgi:ComF family protein
VSILNLIFPRHCYGCGKNSRYLCLDCQSRLVVRSIKHSQPPFFKGGSPELAKGQGVLNQVGFDRLSLFRYHDPIKAMVHDLKFEFVSDIIPELALLMSRTLKSKFPSLLKYWQEEQFVLVPIPLHQHRFNWRGFNQTELLVRELSPLINLKYENLLIRTKDTTPQTSIKDKLSRHTNINNAFSMINGSMVKYILVDDVYTTGSTMRSAISCLPENSDIWILTIA